MEQSPHAPNLPLLGTESAAGEVKNFLADIGASDGEYLFHVVQTLMQAARGHSHAKVVLSTAEAIAGSVAERVVRFAAAVEITGVAALAHSQTAASGGLGSSSPAIDDHLVVLAGDYLYAQAAYITANLHNLNVMALLADTIKRQCAIEMASAGTFSHARDSGLYVLSTVGAGTLLQADDELLDRLRHYGMQLDAIGGNARSQGVLLANDRRRKDRSESVEYRVLLDAMVTDIWLYRTRATKSHRRPSGARL